MSWLRALEIGLDLTNVAINIGNAERLNELQRLGQSAELRKQIAKELRNQVFSFRQAADSALSTETESVFRTTIAMRLLERRLQDTQITPDDFEEFADKEYVHQVTKHISDNATRLYYQCSADDQLDITDAVNAIINLPDLEYFVTNYDKYTELIGVKRTVDEYSERNSSGTGFGLGWVRVGAALALALFAATSGSAFMWIVAGAAWVGGHVMLSRWQNADAYKEAKSRFDSLNNTVSFKRMEVLNRQYGTLERAQQLRIEAESSIRAAFGQDTPIMLK